MATMRRSTSTRNTEKLQRWESKIIVAEEEERLLPGICDEITLHEVLTKLPWTSMSSISGVNKKWRRIVRNREVYKARVNTCSTQILVPIMHRASAICNGMFPEYNIYNEAISLYDPTKEKWYLLPPVPPLMAGIPDACGCVCLNGKVYVLGGLDASNKADFCDELPNLGDYDRVARKEVYSLDLAAGETNWKQCADMNCARAWFQCGVNDGNIYVFWGVSGWGRREVDKDVKKAVVEVEVYDPEEDLWDLVAPVPSPDVVRYSLVNKVAVVGDKFVTHSYFRSVGPESLVVEHSYDTSKDEWSIVTHTKGEMNPSDAMVAVNHKLHKLNPQTSDLKVYEEATNSWAMASSLVSWKFLEPCILPLPFKYYRGLGGVASTNCHELSLCSSIPKLKEVQDLLALSVIRSDFEEMFVALARTSDVESQFRNYPKQFALFQGKWSGSHRLQLVFQEIDCPYMLVDWQKSSLSPIHL